MSLFVIGDTHLSLSTDKPMDIFGGWKNYMQRLEENWRSVVQPQDTVIIPGDVSWGMSLEQAKEDFLFSAPAARKKNPDEGQPRLLVDHPRKDGELFGRKRAGQFEHPAQQCGQRGRTESVRLPRLDV